MALQAVEPLIVAVQARFDGRQIVALTVQASFDRRQVIAIPAGLFEDVAGNHLLAFDLALDNVDARLEMLELVPRYLSSHCKCAPQFRSINLAQVVTPSSDDSQVRRQPET